MAYLIHNQMIKFVSHSESKMEYPNNFQKTIILIFIILCVCFLQTLVLQSNCLKFLYHLFNFHYTVIIMSKLAKMSLKMSAI